MHVHMPPRGWQGDRGFFPLRLAVSPVRPKGYRSMSQASARTVTMIEMAFPDQTNHYGTLFGGHALRLMDKAAFVAASRYARKTVVTACSERVDFQAAVRHGSLVELTARVIATGRSSMTVSVDLVGGRSALRRTSTLCSRSLRPSCHG